jgi:hypothetical protein
MLKFRSWHADCYFDEDASEWKRLQTSGQRVSRDNPAIAAGSGFIVVAGGTVTDALGQKRRSKVVEKLVQSLSESSGVKDLV